MKSSDITGLVKSTTKKWAKQRKAEERSSRSRSCREYMYSDRVNQSGVAKTLFAAAYKKVSDNGRLPAHARQIFYAVRREIETQTERPLDSRRITQVLLPKYINEHETETRDWRIVYDPRGNLREPHTETDVPLGTMDVDDYLRSIRSHKVEEEVEFFDLLDMKFPTKGPSHRYQAILFIEKEGFNPLFAEVKLAERYDIAIMSTKGQSVVASRHLVDELCHSDTPVLVFHDFDKEGFEIAQTLSTVSRAAREGGRVRYRFRNTVNAIDCGLRLTDVERWNLESEEVNSNKEITFRGDSNTTPEERQFLLGRERVELNAFTSSDFIEFVESKLDEQGIKKMVPESETLELAYRRACQIQFVNDKIKEASAEAVTHASQVELPVDLSDQIEEAFKENPSQPWDAVVAGLVRETYGKEDEQM